LADRGARLDLEAAAGVGRVDLVEGFFDSGAAPDSKPATAGLMWACEYGHVPVVELLLNRGVDAATVGASGMTPLHWAAIGGQAAVASLLVARGAPLEIVNSYGGTPLGQALWSARNDGTGIYYRPVVRVLLEAGANADLYVGMREQVVWLISAD
jgi:ankyrin repeat protein